MSLAFLGLSMVPCFFSHFISELVCLWVHLCDYPLVRIWISFISFTYLDCNQQRSLLTNGSRKWIFALRFQAAKRHTGLINAFLPLWSALLQGQRMDHGRVSEIINKNRPFSLPNCLYPLLYSGNIDLINGLSEASQEVTDSILELASYNTEGRCSVLRQKLALDGRNKG